MATASVLIEADDMECPVCHEQFTNPKLLPCGHLLCRHCLVNWLKSKTKARCPLCREAIVDPQAAAAGKSLDDVAGGFPSDLAMAALVESQQLLSKDHACLGCVTQTAASVCLTCGDLLCSSCVTVHKRMSLLRHHVTEELSSLTAEKLAGCRPSFCAAHADKTSDVYCPTHGASICFLCATTEHRQCPEVTQLETKMEEARAVLAELAATLSAGERELGRGIDKMDQHLRDTKKRTQNAIAEIEALCDRLEAAVKACRLRVKELALSACSDVKEAVDEGKAFLSQRRGKLTLHKTVIERVQGIRSGDAVYNMSSSMKKRASDLDCSAALPMDAKVISTVTLVIDPEAVSRVERELSELGQVNFAPADAAVYKQQPAFGFHDNRGRRIVLTKNQLTAERTTVRENRGDGIVMSRAPMQTQKLYEVRIDETDNSWDYQFIFLGVVTEFPHAIILPQWSSNLTSAVVVRRASVQVNSIETNCTVGAPLRGVRKGDRVGLALDSSRTLRLYINGDHLGVVAPDVADPCYVMIDVRGTWRKVTSLPLTNLKRDVLKKGTVKK